jgi:hypothetical protein
MNNRSFIQNIYTTTQSLGITNTQDNLSRLCGRTPAYISSIKARNIPLSTSAALTLHMNINQHIDKKLPKRQKSIAKKLSEILLIFAKTRSIDGIY